jgi:site-specific recombinase
MAKMKLLNMACVTWINIVNGACVIGLCSGNGFHYLPQEVITIMQPRFMPLFPDVPDIISIHVLYLHLML